MAIRFATSDWILMRKASQDDGSLLRLEVRQDQGDGLRVLLLDEIEQVRRIRAADEVERPHLQGACEPVDDVHGLLRAEGFFQQLAGIVDAARGDELLGHHQLVELHQDEVPLLRFYALQPGNLEGELFDLVFPQVLEDL